MALSWSSYSIIRESINSQHFLFIDRRLMLLFDQSLNRKQTGSDAGHVTHRAIIRVDLGVVFPVTDAPYQREAAVPTVARGYDRALTHLTPPTPTTRMRRTYCWSRGLPVAVDRVGLTPGVNPGTTGALGAVIKSSTIITALLVGSGERELK